MGARSLLALAALFLLASVATPIRAGALTFSALSSDSTPASALGGHLDIAVSGSTLTLTLSNTSSSFNISQLYFNGAVSGLSLTSATHSAEGNVTAAWSLVPRHGNDTKAASFGTFDFLLKGPNGAVHKELIGPGESIAFVLAISGAGPFGADDFQILSSGKDPSFAVAKFVNGPGDDSAFGSSAGVVPEPSTASLLFTGLAGLAIAGRRTRRAAR